MLEYCVDIWSACGQPPRQVMLYVGKAVMQMPARVEQAELRYSFRCLDIRKIPAEPLLEAGCWSLAILCRGGDQSAASVRLMRRIARLEGRARGDAMAKLLVLSGLRSIESEVRREIERMPIEIDVMENAVLRELTLAGQAKGREAGRAEEGIAILTRLLRRKFGDLPAWVSDRLGSASTEQLEAWAERLLDAKSLDELLDS